MSHWRIRLMLVVVLLVGVLSMLVSSTPALASVPGTTIGANNCPSAGLPCIKDAYQDEVNITVVFTASALSLGYDYYNFHWAVFGNWVPQVTPQAQTVEFTIYYISWPADYTFEVEGCRTHLLGSACSPWSNRVTVSTSTPAIAQRGAVNPITPITQTPGVSGFYQHYANGVSVYCHEDMLWSDAAQNWRSQCQNAYFVYGAIRSEWAALGWELSVLGYPITDELGTPDGIGRYNHFQGGSIYWTPSTGAHEVHGGIRDKWASLGWEQSLLGYPLSDEIGTPDGIGRFNQFQWGYIYWTPSTGAHEVHGAILAQWASMGWEQGCLGYPTSDEQSLRFGGRISYFQNGYIQWYPTTGPIPHCFGSL